MASYWIKSVRPLWRKKKEKKEAAKNKQTKQIEKTNKTKNKQTKNKQTKNKQTKNRELLERGKARYVVINNLQESIGILLLPQILW